MFYPVREKSWSVFLVKGYIDNDQIRAKRCENCKSTTEVLASNYGNPNLLLYGCKDSKCKHRLVRLDLEVEMACLKSVQVPVGIADAQELAPKISA
jgi:hypothetical protein